MGVVVLAVAAALLAGSAIDIPLSGDLSDRRLVATGSTAPMEVMVSNPLSVPDVLVLSFHGPAVEGNHLNVQFPDDPAVLSCEKTPTRESCHIRLEAGESRDITVDLLGVTPGRESMTVSVASSTSSKQARARTFMVVTGETFWRALERTAAAIL